MFVSQICPAVQQKRSAAKEKKIMSLKVQLHINFERTYTVK